MANRLAQEPAYPQTQTELKAYCERLIEALRRELGSRLIGVLLCGSWARGEATPPESDADITVIEAISRPFLILRFHTDS